MSDFELDFLAVRARTSANLARKLLSERAFAAQWLRPIDIREQAAQRVFAPISDGLGWRRAAEAEPTSERPKLAMTGAPSLFAMLAPEAHFLTPTGTGSLAAPAKSRYENSHEAIHWAGALARGGTWRGIQLFDSKPNLQPRRRGDQRG